MLRRGRVHSFQASQVFKARSACKASCTRKTWEASQACTACACTSTACACISKSTDTLQGRIRRTQRVQSQSSTKCPSSLLKPYWTSPDLYNKKVTGLALTELHADFKTSPVKNQEYKVQMFSTRPKHASFATEHILEVCENDGSGLLDRFTYL